MQLIWAAFRWAPGRLRSGTKAWAVASADPLLCRTVSSVRKGSTVPCGAGPCRARRPMDREGSRSPFLFQDRRPRGQSGIDSVLGTVGDLLLRRRRCRARNEGGLVGLAWPSARLLELGLLLPFFPILWFRFFRFRQNLFIPDKSDINLALIFRNDICPSVKIFFPAPNALPSLGLRPKWASAFSSVPSAFRRNPERGRMLHDREKYFHGSAFIFLAYDGMMKRMFWHQPMSSSNGFRTKSYCWRMGFSFSLSGRLRDKSVSWSIHRPRADARRIFAVPTRASAFFV